MRGPSFGGGPSFCLQNRKGDVTVGCPMDNAPPFDERRGSLWKATVRRGGDAADVAAATLIGPSKERTYGTREIPNLEESGIGSEPGGRGLCRVHAKLHFKKMYDGVVPHTLQNLKDARSDEDAEVKIYTDYARVAREEGFADLSDFFEGLAAIEKSHEDRFDLLIERINNDEVFRRKEVKVWVCTVCGHIEIGTEPPEKCPVCAHPRGHFEIKAENY